MPIIWVFKVSESNQNWLIYSCFSERNDDRLTQPNRSSIGHNQYPHRGTGPQKPESKFIFYPTFKKPSIFLDWYDPWEVPLAVSRYVSWHFWRYRHVKPRAWIGQLRHLGPPPSWFKWNQISNFMTGLGSLVFKWPEKAKNFFTWLFFWFRIIKRILKNGVFGWCYLACLISFW